MAAPGSPVERVAVESLLDAMEGVAYLLDRDGIIAAVGRDGWGSFAHENDLPLLAMCSYCQRVAGSADQEEREWIAAENYYRRGGSSRGGSSAVRISHGICPRCMKERVEPLPD